MTAPEPYPFHPKDWELMDKARAGLDSLAFEQFLEARGKLWRTYITTRPPLHLDNVEADDALLRKFHRDCYEVLHALSPL